MKVKLKSEKQIIVNIKNLICSLLSSHCNKHALIEKGDSGSPVTNESWYLFQWFDLGGLADLSQVSVHFAHTKVQLICEESPRHLQGSTCLTSLFPLTWDNAKLGGFTFSHSLCYTTTQGNSGHESVVAFRWTQVKADNTPFNSLMHT